ncbi:MAG: hypothetical protein CMF25_04225 [Kangiellaceae bacterium]|nr:hypothetical protein [Kangiellaceae bacterium]|tara:strand:- start:8725 stop:10314 length:1590 start_codon:yes stop_codon:yes gene_type:complete
MSDDLLFEDDDELSFAGEEEDASPAHVTRPWQILIVDDEEEVHNVTTLVLSGYEVLGRPIEFLHAYSGKEAKAILSDRHRDIALVLLDVVMETDDAGLDVVHFVRNELDDHFVRVVLRTGQPGQAPEERIIREYDINDYKEKTELASTKLKTLVHTTIRSYSDMVALEAARNGLEHVIDASARLFEAKSMYQFASAALRQLTGLLNVSQDAIYCKFGETFAGTDDPGVYHVLAGTGCYFDFVEKELRGELPEKVRDSMLKALELKQNIYEHDALVAYFVTEKGVEHILFIENYAHLDELDRRLIDLFCSNLAIAFESLFLKKEMEQTQHEMVYILGEAVETHSDAPRHHVERVAEVSHMLAIKLGMSEELAEILRCAAPLHDLGNIGIPDEILNKPGKLTDEEFNIIKSHTCLGHQLLKRSNKAVLQFGATIALQHHECWDGSGYPSGLAGEEIDILGRIVAVADVFDTLMSHRTYKLAWPVTEVVDYFKEQRGKQFDPQLVDILLANMDDIHDIWIRYPDEDVKSSAN